MKTVTIEVDRRLALLILIARKYNRECRDAAINAHKTRDYSRDGRTRAGRQRRAAMNTLKNKSACLNDAYSALSEYFVSSTPNDDELRAIVEQEDVA